MSERRTRWFVEPLDASTNESAMADLARVVGATDDNVHYERSDKEGRHHDVVEVPYTFVVRMENNAQKFDHKFRVFKQQDGERAMSLWPFGRQKKLARTAKVKRIAQALKERREKHA